MNDFGEPAKADGPPQEARGPRLDWLANLPAQLQRELKYPRIVGCRWLTRKALRIRCRIRRAKLIHSGNIRAVQQVEGVCNQLHAPAFAERNAFGYPQIDLEKAGSCETIPPQVSVAASMRGNQRHRKGGTVIGQTNIRRDKMRSRNEV